MSVTPEQRRYVEWRGKKIDVDAQLHQLRKAKYEDSLYEFLKACWRIIDPAPFSDGWVVRAVCEHLEAVVDGELRRLMIHIPPRCSKSSIVSVAFPAWVWAQPWDGPTSGPGVPILAASYSFKLALRDNVKSRRLIKSPWYQKYWGGNAPLEKDRRVIIAPDNDQKIRFGNTRGGERLITSVDGGVTGEGGNINIIDDPNNAKEVLSEAVIESTNQDWYDASMSTRLNDPKTGAFVVVQQRLGEADLSGHIMSKEDWPDWCHLMLPMEFEKERAALIYPNKIGWSDPRTEEGELLWPERFGHKEVNTLKINLGSWRAAGQLQQRPEPQGGGIIKRQHWQLWPPEGEETDDLGRPKKPLAYPEMDYILASLDTGYTENTMNDPSALTVWGVWSGDPVARDVQIGVNLRQRVYGQPPARVMLMHAWSGRMELHDLVNHVGKICGRGPTGMRVHKILIENKAAGISVAQELRRLFATAGFGVQLSDPGRVDKVARLYSVQNIFEERVVYCPDRQWAEAVIHQCGTFPNAEHDDLVDTVSQALRHLRDLGMLSRPEERMQELNEALQQTGSLPPLYPA